MFKAWKDATSREAKNKSKKARAQTAAAKQVAALQKALSELAASQAEMDKMRKEENTVYVKSKADMEQGLEGGCTHPSP